MNSMHSKRDAGVRCGIVLAAGEGVRLQPFIHKLLGKVLPKQYVNFTGTRSMLEHTFDRAEGLIPTERLFTVVSSDHLKYSEVEKQLSGRPKGSVILQPENKETGPGILLPLMHLYKRYPESVVVIFPSDHCILEEEIFMGHVDLACRAVERDPSRLVLLGAEPDEPDPEYGYILPHREKEQFEASVIHKVSLFVEKPEPHQANELIQNGGLWNTLVLVFKARTLLESVRKVVPSLYRTFFKVEKALGTSREMKLVRQAYREMKPVNFSSGLLSPLSLKYPSHLRVIPVRGVFWSDWGSEQRIIKTLQKKDFNRPLRCCASRMGMQLLIGA